jgi:hypothetical protein
MTTAFITQVSKRLSIFSVRLWRLWFLSILCSLVAWGALADDRHCNKWKSGLETLGPPNVKLGGLLSKFRTPVVFVERAFRRPIDGAVVDIVETDPKSFGLKIRMEVVQCQGQYVVVGILTSGGGSLKPVAVQQWEVIQRRELSAYKHDVEIEYGRDYIELSTEKGRLRDPAIHPSTDVMRLRRHCYFVASRPSTCAITGFQIYYARL